MTALLPWLELVIASIGVISAILWYFAERRRLRYTSLFLGAWCGLLVVFRVARFMIPSPLTAEEIELFNALANWLFLLGALITSVITVLHLIGVLRHGRNH